MEATHRTGIMVRWYLTFMAYSGVYSLRYWFEAVWDLLPKSLAQTIRITYLILGRKYSWATRKTNTPGGTAFMMGTLLRYCQSDTTQRGDRAESDSENTLSTAKKLRMNSGHSSSSC